MSLVLLISDIAARNIVLRVENGKLHFKAPEGALTPELRQRISTHKDEILAHLTGQTQPEPETLLTDPSSAQERLWFFKA
jgi:pyochelin synthetase